MASATALPALTQGELPPGLPSKAFYVSEPVHRFREHRDAVRLVWYLLYVALSVGVLAALVHTDPAPGRLRQGMDAVVQAYTPERRDDGRPVPELPVASEDVPRLAMRVVEHAAKRLFVTPGGVDAFVAPRIDARVPARVFAVAAVMPAEVRLIADCEALHVSRPGCPEPQAVATAKALLALSPEFLPALSRYESGGKLDDSAPQGQRLRSVLLGAVHTGDVGSYRAAEVARNSSEFTSVLGKGLRETLATLKPASFTLEFYMLSTRSGLPFCYSLHFDHTYAWKVELTSEIRPLRLSLTGPYSEPAEKSWFRHADVQGQGFNQEAGLRAGLFVVFIFFSFYWARDFWREWCSCEKWDERFELRMMPTGGRLWVPKPGHSWSGEEEQAAEEAEEGSKKKRKRKLNLNVAAGARKLLSLLRYMASFEKSRSLWPCWTAVSVMVSLALSGVLAYGCFLGTESHASLSAWFPTTLPFFWTKCAKAAEDALQSAVCDPDFSQEALALWPDVLSDLIARGQIADLAVVLAAVHTVFCCVRVVRFCGFHSGTALFGQTVAYAAEDLCDAGFSMGMLLFAVGGPLAALAVYAMPGTLGEIEWYLQFPLLRFLPAFLHHTSEGMPLPSTASFEATKALLAAGNATRRLQGLPGPDLAPAVLPYPATAESAVFALRIVLALFLALFLLLAGNLLTAVMLNAYLRAVGHDGDPGHVIRAHKSLLSTVTGAVGTELRYRRWYCKTRKQRKKYRNFLKLQEKESAGTLSPRAKRKQKKAAEAAAALGGELESLSVQLARMIKPWRVQPFAYLSDAEDTASERAYLWARLTHIPATKRMLEHFVCPYTGEMVYPSAGGGVELFECQDVEGLTRILRNLGGVEDVGALALVLYGLYGTSVLPSGVRRSADGYFHGLGVGEDDQSPWQQTPNFGTTSHVERALALQESRLGAEMYKLNHAQEALHQMMAQMQRQAEGMDRAQQVVVQYLVSQQAERHMAANVSKMQVAQQKHFFPG